MWLMQFSVFCHHRTSKRKRWILKGMFLFENIRDYDDFFLEGVGIPRWTLYPFHMYWMKKCLCSSIMPVFLLFIILWRLIIWSLLLSIIILGRNGSFPRTPILFWIIFTQAVWLTLYKNTHKISNKSIVRKKWMHKINLTEHITNLLV